MSVEITLEQTDELIRNCKEQIAFTQECSRILDLKLLRYFCVYPVVEVPLVLQKRMVVNTMAFLILGEIGGTRTHQVAQYLCQVCCWEGWRGPWGPQTQVSDL